MGRFCEFGGFKTDDFIFELRFERICERMWTGILKNKKKGERSGNKKNREVE